MHGRAVTRNIWMAVRIATAEKAAVWRARTRRFFQEIDDGKARELVMKMAGKHGMGCEVDEVDLMGIHPAIRLYRAI